MRPRAIQTSCVVPVSAAPPASLDQDSHDAHEMLDADWPSNKLIRPPCFSLASVDLKAAAVCR